MSGVAACALINLGVCGAVAVACWVTQSAWPLLGLVFLLTWRKDK